MKALRAYITLREDLVKQREEIDSLLKALDTFYRVGDSQRALIDDYKSLAEKTKDTIVKVQRKSSTREDILDYLKTNPGAATSEIASALGISGSGALYNLNAAQKAGLVKRSGSSWRARWVHADSSEKPLINAVPAAGGRPARINTREYTLSMIAPRELVSTSVLLDRFKTDGVKVTRGAVQSMLRRMTKDGLLAHNRSANAYIMTKKGEGVAENAKSTAS